jgi:hypothetical protein
LGSLNLEHSFCDSSRNRLIPTTVIRSQVDFLIIRGRNRLNAGEKEELFEHLENMLKTLKFGSITLIVQDGRIVQIEKNEKVRLQSNKNR